MSKTPFKILFLFLFGTIRLCYGQEAVNSLYTSTDSFAVLIPDFDQIDLACLVAPDTSDKKIVCCAAAAFTGLIRPGQDHLNIAGNHIADGEVLKGYNCRNNTGGFIYYKNKTWKFVNAAEYSSSIEQERDSVQCAFGQCIVILDSTEHTTFPKGYDHVAYYRVLGEFDNKLSFFESTVPMTLERFLVELRKLHPSNALYMEMGKNWNYTWWRNANGNCTMQHPYVNGSNWIVFKKD